MTPSTLVRVSMVLMSAASTSGVAQAVVSGTATYRERLALPADAAFEATLEDVTRADAPAQTLGHARFVRQGQPPFPFEIPFDSRHIDLSHRYVVRARITHGDRLLFTADGAYPVLAGGYPSHVSLTLVRATSGPPPVAAPVLEGPTWVLTRLGGESIEAGVREAHLVFRKGESQVVGSTGCNRLSGRYHQEGTKLTLGPIMTTRMACPGEPNVEPRFLAALERVASCRVAGRQLDLFDAEGAIVARFDGRAPR